MSKVTRSKGLAEKAQIPSTSTKRTRKRKREPSSEDMGNCCDPEPKAQRFDTETRPKTITQQPQKRSKSKQPVYQPCQICPGLQAQIAELHKDLEKARAKVKDDFKLTNDDSKRNADYRKQRDEAEQRLKYVQEQYEDAKEKIADQREQLKKASKGKAAKTGSEEQEYKEKYDQTNVELQDIKQKLKEKSKQLKDTLDGAKHLNDTISSLKQDLRNAKSDNDRLLHRVSELAGAKLTAGNPNVVDLNDQNRPTKLAERYMELYDNTWTDAFSALNDAGCDDEKAISILLQILKNIYNECRAYTEKDLQTFENNVTKCFHFEPKSAEAMVIIKQYLDRRKKIYSSLKTDLMPRIEKVLSPVLSASDRKSLKPYTDETLDICLLMCIQDPPVYIASSSESTGSPFDTNKYKAYTSLGKQIEYVVWPPLYLHEDGAMLSKGVAQGKRDLVKALPAKPADEINKRTTPEFPVRVQQEPAEENARAKSASVTVLTVGTGHSQGGVAETSVSVIPISDGSRVTAVRPAASSRDSQEGNREMLMKSTAATSGAKTTKRQAPSIPDVYDPSQKTETYL